MRQRCGPLRLRSQAGQSLIESALLIPVLLIFIFNIINFSYCFLVAIHIASAPREGVQFSILGGQTPAGLEMPLADAVRDLTYDDMKTLAGTSGRTARVCSKKQGVTGSPPTANCTLYPSGATFAAVDSDPEAPYFVLNRVDVAYQITPLIKAGFFGFTVVPPMTIHRQVSMRAID